MNWLEELLIRIFGKPKPPIEPPVDPTNPPTNINIYQAINAERIKRGLPKFRRGELIEKSAQKYAEYLYSVDAIKDKALFTHGDVSARLDAEGVKYYAYTEVMAHGTTDPRQAVRLWMNSLVGHKEAILSDEHTRAGAGNKGKYWIVTICD